MPKHIPALRLVLSLLGLAIALYLTLLHYVAAVPLACPAAGAVDCAAVLTSPRSVILGIPIAVFGLFWFAVSTSLAVAGLRGTVAGRVKLRRVFTIWAAIGAVSVVYLVYLELLVIGRICIWCSGVHLIVLALLGLEVFADASEGRF